jgi:hypothetical protein
LCYESYPEFVAMIRSLEQSRRFGSTLGANGRRFFRDHYAWPVIERKYLNMFQHLKGRPPVRTMEPLSGWFERRRRNLPPARDVLSRLPRGAVTRTAEPAAAGLA